MKLSAADRRRTLSILERILRQPTAPFHEHRVRRELQAVLDEAGVPHRTDAAGNLVARYRAGRAKPFAMAAHMDHPGFEVLSAAGGSAAARWNGQVPPFDLKGARLALCRAGRRVGTAVVADGDGRRPKEKASALRLKVPPGTRAGDFGHADLVAFRLSGGRVVSKALDNVAGCAAMAAVLDLLARRRLPGDVTALFTRAEEVGFHGALAAIRAGTVPRRLPMVVLECSKAIAGVEMGSGPVIRVGDKASVFDPDLAAACEIAARALQAEDPSFRFQRRLMDGGTCEASAFGLSGWRAVCLAFPLGNYHNVGPRGLAPEYIAQSDFLSGVRLLTTFAGRGLDPVDARRRLTRWVHSRFGGAELKRLKASA